MSHIHTIPVDPSLTIEEAWKELCIFGRRITYTGLEWWGSVQCSGECDYISTDTPDDAAPPSVPAAEETQ